MRLSEASRQKPLCHFLACGGYSCQTGGSSEIGAKRREDCAESVSCSGRPKAIDLCVKLDYLKKLGATDRMR